MIAVKNVSKSGADSAVDASSPSIPYASTMVSSVAERLPVRLELVDSNGLLPLRATDEVFPTAYAFRRYLQKELPPHLERMPKQDLFSSAEELKDRVYSAREKRIAFVSSDSARKGQEVAP